MIRLMLNFEKGEWKLENPSGQRGFWHPDGYPTEWSHLKTALSKLRKILKERPVALYNIYIQGQQVSMTVLEEWPEDKKPPIPFDEQISNLEAELFGWQRNTTQPRNPAKP
jgi:hypothetical protein